MGRNSLIGKSSIVAGQLEPKMRFKRSTTTVINDNATIIQREVPLVKTVVYEDGGTFNGIDYANIVPESSWNVGEVALIYIASDMKLCGLYTRTSLTKVARYRIDLAVGMIVSVYNGTASKNSIWQLTSGTQIGTDNIVFTKIDDIYRVDYPDLIGASAVELDNLRVTAITDNGTFKIKYFITGISASSIRLFYQLLSNGTGVSGYLIGHASVQDGGSVLQDSALIANWNWNNERYIDLVAWKRFRIDLEATFTAIDGTNPYIGIQFRTSSGVVELEGHRELTNYRLA